MVGNGWNGSGTSATEKPYGVTLFGNGWDRLESPVQSSSPGHPKELSGRAPRTMTFVRRSLM
jgi:hypothetical protein